MEPIYEDLTKSLAVFLATGMAVGLSTFLGLRYIEAIGSFGATVELEATAMVVMVAISSFFISPIISALTGLYIGYYEPDRGQTVAFSTFASFLGFFALNITSIGMMLALLGESLSPAGIGDPARVFQSFVVLENQAAFLSFPSVITGLSAGYLGSDINQ